MNSSTLITLAEKGTEQDVINLLKAQGATKFYNNSALIGETFAGTGADYIAEGVNQDKGPQKEAKLRAVTNFLTGQGEFAEKQEVKPDVVQALREEFRAAVEGLTERLTAAEETIKQMERAAQVQTILRRPSSVVHPREKAF